jgi:hypothetical protein
MAGNIARILVLDIERRVVYIYPLVMKGKAGDVDVYGNSNLCIQVPASAPFEREGGITVHGYSPLFHIYPYALEF